MHGINCYADLLSHRSRENIGRDASRYLFYFSTVSTTSTADHTIHMSSYKGYRTGQKRPWDFSGGEVSGTTCDGDLETEPSSPVDHGLPNIKKVLQDGLDCVTKAANINWAFGGALLQPVNPGLTLKKSGIVGLPLSVNDIARIQEVAETCPSSVDETISNERTHWRISPDQFTLQNPAWEGYVRDLASNILGKPSRYFGIELIGLRLEQASDVAAPDL